MRKGKHRSICFYGRGGQGAVTSSVVLAKAAFYDNKYCQAFPNFGVERRGAPVTAYARISEKPIRIRSSIYKPNYIIVLDSTLLNNEVVKGINKEGIILVNSDKKPKELKLNTNAKIYTIDVTKKALEIIGKPFVNIAILGFFSCITDEITIKSLKKAVDENFEGKQHIAELNKKLIDSVIEECKKYR